MSILCTICMREGSKGVKNKNLKKINNKPLMWYSINQAKNSKLFDKIVISTDSKKILNLSKKYGAIGWFLRSKKLSNDNAPKIPVIRDLLIKSEKHFNKNFDIIVDLDATSPLLLTKDIINSVKLFQSKKASNLISVCPSRKNPYFNMIEIINGKINICKKGKNGMLARRQDAPKVYDINASIYIWNRKYLLKGKNLLSKQTIFYEMPEERSIDIDTKFDWKIVKHLL